MSVLLNTKVYLVSHRSSCPVYKCKLALRTRPEASSVALCRSWRKGKRKDNKGFEDISEEQEN